MRRVLVLAFFLLLATASDARQGMLIGRVVGVADGDTLTILASGNEQIRIRLAHIDAPEKAQPFGAKAKLALSQLCFGKSATVQVVDHDKYGRTVGLVDCAGAAANRAMVAQGLAWAYAKNLRAVSTFSSVEAEARSQRKGLWSEKAPVPPWEFRKATR